MPALVDQASHEPDIDSEALGQATNVDETCVSNGGRSAVPGGLRTRWETNLFASVYDDSLAPRPVYGALDLTCDVHGGSPRFGSSFVVLTPECFDRATFCVGDSHVGPTDIGTIDEFTSILAGLVELCAAGDGFGHCLTLERLVEVIDTGTDQPRASRDLDHYVEAQVHGRLDLTEDVAAVVLDPSFEGTSVEDDLRSAANQFSFSLEWHEGSQVRAAEIPDDLRGADISDIARRIAQDDSLIDAETIGGPSNRSHSRHPSRPAIPRIPISSSTGNSGTAASHSAEQRPDRPHRDSGLIAELAPNPTIIIGEVPLPQILPAG